MSECDLCTPELFFSLNPSLQPPELPSPQTIGMAIGITLGSVVVLLGIVITALCCVARNNIKKRKINPASVPDCSIDCSRKKCSRYCCTCTCNEPECCYPDDYDFEFKGGISVNANVSASVSIKGKKDTKKKEETRYVQYYEERDEDNQKVVEEVEKYREEIKGKKEKSLYKTYSSDPETLMRRLIEYFHSTEERENVTHSISYLLRYTIFREYFWRYYYYNQSNEEESLVNTLSDEKDNTYYQLFSKGDSLKDKAVVESPEYEDNNSVYNKYSLLSASPLILNFYGVTKDSTMVHHNYNHGNLRELYDSKDADVLSITTKLNIALTVGHALQSIHDKNLCRGYISSEDVIIDNPKDDLEHAYYLLHYVLHSQQSQLEITEEISAMIAPELREENPLTPTSWTIPADVYSFGNLLWEIYSQTSIQNGEQEDTMVSIPAECPWRSIILQCWNEDPEKRPSLSSIIDQLGELRLSLRVVLGCNC